MATFTIETYLANSEHGGVERTSQQIEAASQRELIYDCIGDLLNEFKTAPATPEELASVRVLTCDFIEADSSRLHGTCYFEVTIDAAESLVTRLQRAAEEL